MVRRVYLFLPGAGCYEQSLASINQTFLFEVGTMENNENAMLCFVLSCV